VDKKLQKIFDKHKEDRNTVAILQDLQSEYGYVPEKECKELSLALDISMVDMFGVATFYSQFKLEKEGKYVISLCRGTACHVNKSESIMKALETFLGVQECGTTSDGLFTLVPVNCIGACARAPAMMINGTVYGSLTDEKAIEIVKKIKEGDK
jgi:NADH:ubiquinone oxidoreductase subunit E